MTFLEACRVVEREGYTVVQRAPYERLRTWLDETNGWPPRDWAAQLPDAEKQP